MTTLMVEVGLVLAGLVLGSFAGAQVWRIRARQLVEDKAAGESVSAKELQKLKPLLQRARTDRSLCLHCKHQLAWYDLIPLASWITTQGRCRYCKHRIGYFEPAIELGMATFFLVSYLCWPYALEQWSEIARLAVWLLAGVPLGILFAYDQKWSLLPNGPMAIFVGLGATYALLGMLETPPTLASLGSMVGSLAIMSGIYLGLYVYSRGSWIGFGDIKLGVGLAFFLERWELAFLALFLANLIGTIVALPQLLRHTLGRKARMPFGPYLIVATVIAVLFGDALIDAYTTAMVGLLL